MKKAIKNITKSRRYFRIGEIVFNCNSCELDNFDFGKILLINGKEEDGLVDEDTIVTLAMKHNDYEGENECYGDNIYKLCKKWTKLTGEPVCFEHIEMEDAYPFYIPRADENYFRIELRAIASQITKEERAEMWEENKKLFINEEDINACDSDSDRSEMPWDYGKHFD